MVNVTVEAQGLRVTLSRLERLGAFHGDVVVPVSGLIAAKAVDNVSQHLRGVRAPGTGVPGVLMLGTTRYNGKRDFCSVHRHDPGLVVELRNQEFARILVSLSHDEATKLAAAVTALVGADEQDSANFL